MHRILEYTPPKFEMGVPQPAQNYIELKRSQPSGTGFKMSDPLKVQTGVLQVEAISVEDQVEQKTIEKLKELRVDGFKMNCRSGIYYYDIAFPEFKVDIELDGNTHNSEKRLKRDRERDEWTISRGWRVLRIRNEAIKKSLDNRQFLPYLILRYFVYLR
jgi:very-short-patch-repair endonuclease